MSKLTPADLRNPARKSGYDFVATHEKWTNGAGERGFRCQYQQVKPNVYGPLRRSAVEAAQDYCDLVNHGQITPAGPRSPDLSSRDRTARSSTVTRKQPFPHAMKKAIHERAAGKCENCNRRYRFPDAHHIDETAGHSMENGASLCKNCHGITYMDKLVEGPKINDKLRRKRALEKGTPT